MTLNTQLSQRNQHILKATIDRYIVTAEPVGSKTLVEEYDFSVSSATIRNVLGRLEKAGLLYQPHTSAGRVPSDFGYRIYVDHLITPNQKSKNKIQASFEQNLNIKNSNLENLLNKAAKILSSLSGYIALVTLPQNQRSILHHIQLVRINKNQIMLVLVTDYYQTQSVIINTNELPIETEEIDKILNKELEIISNFLNHKLKGKYLQEITKVNWQEIAQDFLKYTDFIKILSQKLISLAQSPKNTPILIHGIAEVLHQPEFSQLEKVQMLLHFLEKDQDLLYSAIFQTVDINLIPQVRVKIGSENDLAPMQSCTLISANYYQENTPVGSVGIIGPTRMLYENTIPLVETTASYLSQILS